MVKSFDFMIRMVVSLVLPLWGVVMVLLGLVLCSASWILCGLAVFAVGVPMLAGNPVIWPHLGDA